MQPFRPLPLLMLVALCSAPALALASPSGVVISGFQTRGPAGGNDEYVEIRNTSAANVDISGWKLQGCAAGTPGNASNRATVGANIVLTPGQYYLFTNTASAAYATGFTDFAGNNFSGIQLLDAANVRQDGVGSAQSPCREGTGFNTPTANGASDAFARNQDTDNNIADFSGPQATNPHNSGGIVIVVTCANDGARIFQIQGRGHVSPMNTQTVCNVPGIVTQLLYEEPFRIVVPRGHKWARRKSVRVDELADENPILLGVGHCFREQVLEACPELNRADSRVTRGNSLETVRNMVASGLGVSVLPRDAMTAKYHSNLVVPVPFARPVTSRRIALAWRKSFPRPQAIAAVRDAIAACRARK